MRSLQKIRTKENVSLLIPAIKNSNSAYKHAIWAILPVGVACFILITFSGAEPYSILPANKCEAEVVQSCEPLLYTKKPTSTNNVVITKKSPTTIENPMRKKITSIIKNTPMEKMLEPIINRDKQVAAYLVGIAMKESKFGKYSPKKNGAECYNYWGYRGKENTTASGYSCFNSPEHAIQVVGDRIESMVKRGARNPAEMISWKCGSTCAGHDPDSVRKWIADVSIHYYQLVPSGQIAKNK